MVYLDDPNRKLLEIDTETRQGPALFRWLTLGMEYLIGAIVALIVAVSSNVVGRSLFNHSCLGSMSWRACCLFGWCLLVRRCVCSL